MASSLLRLYSSGVSVGSQGYMCCAAPSGGFYYGAANSDLTAIQLIRVNSGGSIAWQKEISTASVLSEFSDGKVAIVSNGSNVVLLGLEADAGSGYPNVAALMYDSSGTLLWSKYLPLTYDTGYPKAECAVMDASGNLFISAMDPPGNEPCVAKFSGSTGALLWIVSTRATGVSAALPYYGPLRLMSGGDVVTMLRGDLYSSPNRTYVQRLSGSDGSVVWSRRITLPQPNLGGIALDGSDNTFVFGLPTNGTNGPQTAVAKLDSSGTTLWNVTAIFPTTQGANPYKHDSGPLGAASSSAVMIPVNVGPDASSNSRAGTLTIDTAGSAARLSYFVRTGATGGGVPRTGGETGTNAQIAYPETISSVTDVVLASNSPSAADDGTYGAYARATVTYNASAGTMTIASGTYTRVAAPTGLASTTGPTPSVTSGSLLVETITTAVSYAVTGLAPTTAFGQAYVQGLVGAFTPTTRFGLATAGRVQNVTGLGSTVAFGLPVASLQYRVTGLAPATAFGSATGNLQYPVQSTASTLSFGVAVAVRGPAPRPFFDVSGAAPSTAFGALSATPSVICTTSGSKDTAFGTPTAAYVQQLTGAASATAFGAHTAVMLGYVQGTSTTAFGRPYVAGAGAVVGAPASTAFGAITAYPRVVGTLTGSRTTAFGTPAVGAHEYRLRGAWFRTRFGQPQTERTA